MVDRIGNHTSTVPAIARDLVNTLFLIMIHPSYPTADLAKRFDIGLTWSSSEVGKLQYTHYNLAQYSCHKNMAAESSHQVLVKTYESPGWYRYKRQL